MTDDIREHMTNVKETGKKLYTEFRRERLVLKDKVLSDTIHRNDIKTCNATSAQSHSGVFSKKKQKDKNIWRVDTDVLKYAKQDAIVQRKFSNMISCNQIECLMKRVS
ncbi:hypothetical protein DPMN_079788 [Dreissena polymorpha]|uniref:Uncharacterized protein n=1 Tax=Dreissena polymorpha TaxID=45954 RepID=A0A9D3YUE4_DREPO|nr:hypothetical protein DPMN_079788 [Dreissena polymorpha]